MGSKSTTKTDVAPPSWAQGTITNALGSEKSAYQQGSGLFNQFQPAITSAIQNTANTAANPQPFQTDAHNQLDKVINGDYLTPGSNPFEAAMGKQIGDQAQAGYNTSFGGSGRAHGGLAALLSGQGVGNALGNFYGGIYNNERGLQQQAIGMEPAMNADQYTGANQLIGQTSSASMTPEQLAAMYGASVAGTTGPYGTTTQTTRTPFGLQQAIGLAMMAGGAATGNRAIAMGGAGMAGGGGAGQAAPVAGIGSGTSPFAGLFGGNNGMTSSGLGLSGLLSGSMPTSLGGYSPQAAPGIGDINWSSMFGDTNL